MEVGSVRPSYSTLVGTYDAHLQWQPTRNFICLYKAGFTLTQVWVWLAVYGLQ